MARVSGFLFPALATIAYGMKLFQVATQRHVEMRWDGLIDSQVLP